MVRAEVMGGRIPRAAQRAAHRGRSRLRRAVLGALTGGHRTAPLTSTEQAFVEWIAERSDISVDDARRRFIASWETFRGGPGGDQGRWFNETLHQVLEPLYGDAESEVVASYRQHAPLHLLRLLDSPEPDWVDDVAAAMAGRERCSIVDYGCGLAFGSRALADRLRAEGVAVHLTLVDLPTIKLDFVRWLMAKTDLPHEVMITDGAPLLVPEWDVLIATEFFEHVYDPVEYFMTLDRSSVDGAVLVANISDHEDEFMHVSPRLDALRDAVSERYRQDGPSIHRART